MRRPQAPVRNKSFIRSSADGPKIENPLISLALRQSIMTEILIILGLIILNGVFAMAEIALVSSRKARLEAQANKGDSRAKEALKLANHPDQFLSTVQIGITLIGILTGIFRASILRIILLHFSITTPQ